MILAPDGIATAESSVVPVEKWELAAFLNAMGLASCSDEQDELVSR